MFTGIIQCMGDILSRRGGNEARFTIRTRSPLQRPTLGESIAVNGVCLSVEQFTTDTFMAYASEETIACTTLRTLQPGAVVNVEQALCLGDRMGGHMVTGHVDCIAEVASIGERGASIHCRLAFPAGASRYVVAKGSVALDGISLTINTCTTEHLEVNIIPETQKSTAIQFWKPGVKVNMETDIIGKYVERLLGADHIETPDKPSSSQGITINFLRQNGF